MTLLPSKLLTSSSFAGRRKFTNDDGGWTKHRRMTIGGKFEPKLQIFNERPCSEIGARNNFPGESHTGTHQLARQARRTQPERTYPVLYSPSEFAEASGLCRPRRVFHVVESLDGPICCITKRAQILDCAV